MERLNKPRVFLSHSKQDALFVERLYHDLLKCQVSPWLDSMEIRHGRPWLTSIFEDGIPTCDCVLLYFTQSSLISSMVKKEMDATLVHQLKDKGVAFLPYVADEEVRNSLRVDIQALQVPVWNNNNYEVLLPRVVSEIWASFFERSVIAAVQSERVKRLEAELELQKKLTVSHTIFTPAEELDFKYIFESLNRYDKFKIYKYATDKVTNRKTLHILSYDLKISVMLIMMLDYNNHEYHFSSFERIALDLMQKEDGLYSYDYQFSSTANIADELLMFGLVECVEYRNEIIDGRFSWPNNGHRYMYLPKMQRFRYWQKYNKLLPDEEPLWKLLEEAVEPEE